MRWPRENFNTIGSALITVFIVIAGEDWNAVMYTYVRALEETNGGRNLAKAYFVSLFMIGNIMMLALFTALLLKNQSQTSERREAQLKMIKVQQDEEESDAET